MLKRLDILSKLLNKKVNYCLVCVINGIPSTNFINPPTNGRKLKLTGIQNKYRIWTLTLKFN